MSANKQPDRLAEALRVLARARRGTPAPAASPVSLSLVEVGLRLSALEREVGEVRLRVNGVLFAVVASVLAQLVSKVVAG
jgi:hypothetical protein